MTAEEQALVPHHFLDFLDPLSRYSVTDFRNAALPLVENLLDKGKIPVIVGGTNYYIESILWNVLVNTAPEERDLEATTRPPKLVYDRDKETYGVTKKNKCRGAGGGDSVLKKGKFSDSECDGSDNAAKESAINNTISSVVESDAEYAENLGDKEIRASVQEKAVCDRVGDGNSENNKSSDSESPTPLIAWQDTDITTQELYHRLQQIDPDIAAQYHPNERRKIIR